LKKSLCHDEVWVSIYVITELFFEKDLQKWTSILLKITCRNGDYRWNAP